MKDNKLQIWAINNRPEEKMIWENSFWNYIILLRDTIIPMFFWDGNKYNYKMDKYTEHVDNNVDIIGEHTSKSILNPVLKIKYKDCEIIMRYNYYDWNITIVSENEIEFPNGLFDKDKPDCYYQGFPDKYITKTAYNQSKKRFSCCVESHYNFYTFMFLLKNKLDSK